MGKQILCHKLPNITETEISQQQQISQENNMSQKLKCCQKKIK